MRVEQLLQAGLGDGFFESLRSNGILYPLQDDGC